MNSHPEREGLSFVVYQMGKVGSKTIRSSLERLYGRDRVLHTHSHEEARRSIGEWGRRYGQVIVITGFREPLSRCISAYFQNLTNDNNHWFVGRREEVEQKSIDWLI